jgi:hypothetical protein
MKSAVGAMGCCLLRNSKLYTPNYGNWIMKINSVMIAVIHVGVFIEKQQILETANNFSN